ncbi:hypothetical protein ONS95_000185 [Cadophora gregata]|uniref:uncharacterized protein n=1 Tax=Cadophora gregata TaxID=51156 RepID=UPI0026DBB812|nr:uncharacterized protein ONS95_000185 [Cadophora gregata]KAK0115536.1 hypothetical protein ONS96_013990 [Cadophora gregata f. sp. sojae]KAK0128208.1 hypothetical protein ONS95_000185 [Cadophora gregata]
MDFKRETKVKSEIEDENLWEVREYKEEELEREFEKEEVKEKGVKKEVKEENKWLSVQPPAQFRQQEIDDPDEPLRQQQVIRLFQHRRLHMNRQSLVSTFGNGIDDPKFTFDRVDSYNNIGDRPLAVVLQGVFRPIVLSDFAVGFQRRFEIYPGYEDVFCRQLEKLDDLRWLVPIWYAEDVSPLEYWSQSELEVSQQRLPMNCFHLQRSHGSKNDRSPRSVQLLAHVQLRTDEFLVVAVASEMV